MRFCTTHRACERPGREGTCEVFFWARGSFVGDAARCTLVDAIHVEVEEHNGHQYWPTWAVAALETTYISGESALDNLAEAAVLDALKRAKDASNV